MNGVGASPALELGRLAPEAFLLLGALGAFVAAASRDIRSRRRVAMGVVSGAVAASFAATCFLASSTRVPAVLFSGVIVVDGWVTFVRLLATGGLAVTLLASLGSAEVPQTDDGDDAMAEYLGLLATATASSSLMAAATDILTVVLAIELASLPSYLLVALRRRWPSSQEAALKYVVYGSVATGVALFGFSWLYGAARATALGDLGRAFTTAPLVAAVGAGLVLAGLAFKLAVVPLHMWCPDAYDAAPLPVTMFLSLVPKAGALLLLGRFVSALGSPVVTAVVAGLGALSMTWGNLAALAQTRVRRLLAYSAIAHAGTLLLAFVATGEATATALVAYLAAYVFMNLGAFVAVQSFADLGAETLADYRGLAKRAPGAAAALTVALVSLTGLPPLAGFVGKFTLFSALLGSRDHGLLPAQVPIALVTLAVLNTVVALAYYARVVKALYFEAEGDAEDKRELAPSALRVEEGPMRARAGAAGPRRITRLALLTLLSVGSLVLGVAPSPLLGWAATWFVGSSPLPVTTGVSSHGTEGARSSWAVSPVAHPKDLLRDEPPAR